jgi:hypothetical protein
MTQTFIGIYYKQLKPALEKAAESKKRTGQEYEVLKAKNGWIVISSRQLKDETGK